MCVLSFRFSFFLHNIPESFWGNPAADLFLWILPRSSCKLVITAARQTSPSLSNAQTHKPRLLLLLQACACVCVCQSRVNKIADLHLCGGKNRKLTDLSLKVFISGHQCVVVYVGRSVCLVYCIFCVLSCLHIFWSGARADRLSGVWTSWAVESNVNAGRRNTAGLFSTS